MQLQLLYISGDSFEKSNDCMSFDRLHTVPVNDCYLGYMQLNFYIDMQRCCVSWCEHIDVRFVQINICICMIFFFSIFQIRGIYFNRIEIKFWSSEDVRMRRILQRNFRTCCTFEEILISLFLRTPSSKSYNPNWDG